MNVLLIIDGREAIPLRAIPLLTNWEHLSPDEIVEALVGGSKFLASFDGLIAYRVEEGIAKPIHPGFWENFVAREIEALSERIQEKQISHEDGQSKWREESLAVLPAGSFVWRDEFVPRFQATYPSDEVPDVRAGTNDESEEVAEDKDVELDFDLFISTDSLACLVMEGFDAFGPAKDVVRGNDDVPMQRAAAQEKAILSALQSLGYDPVRVPKWSPGRLGVKGATRAALVGKHPLFLKGSRVFEKAWERLRKSGDVADQR